MPDPRICSCCGRILTFGRGDHVRRNGGYQCVMCYQNGGRPSRASVIAELAAGLNLNTARAPAQLVGDRIVPVVPIGRRGMTAFIEQAAREQAEEKKTQDEKMIQRKKPGVKSSQVVTEQAKQVDIGYEEFEVENDTDMIAG